MKVYKHTIDYKGVFYALTILTPPKTAHNERPPPEFWPKTRDIANYCNINIYTARYHLMKMASNGLALVTDKSINNALRWHIAEPNSPIGKEAGT